MQRSSFQFLIGFLLVWAPLVNSAIVQAPHIEAELIAERTAWLPGAENQVALRLKPESGWHTYWRNPGDSGLPTRLQWTLPAGWSAGEIQWPYPSAQKLGELLNYGYDAETLHLVTLRSAQSDTGVSATARVKAKWLVCHDICIPGEADLDLTLPVGGVATADPRWAAAFEDARQRLPREEILQGIYEIADDEFRLQVNATGARLRGVSGAQFFPYANNLVNHGAPQRGALEAEQARFAQSVSAYLVPPQEQEVVEGLLVLRGTAAEAFAVRAVHGRVATVVSAPAPGIQAPAPEAAPAPVRPESLGLILLFAVLGGLILNLMPCVFPVLTIKAVAVLESHRDEKANALAYTAGVILSCVAVASLLIGLRAAGQEMGWGFQLQSPRFVAALAYLFFALGLSMSGVVEFGTALMGVGQSLTEKKGYRGSFFTGVLAVVVASPCTAPFMGTSLGFALTQPAPVALLIFAALGFGLALPFLLLGLFPVLGRWLPKPGAWMETFKQVMAFPLYLTVVWLVWVLSRQAGTDAGATVLSGLVLLAFALWLLGRRGGTVVRVGGYAAVLLALAVLAHPVLQTSPASAAASSDSEGVWSEARVEQLRAEGRNVFVNFTADWCITCRANEKIALDTDRVRSAMAAKNVAWLVGDWTNGDPKITQVLERFGRPGVPLYLLYAPTGEPEVLPQLLGPDTVIEAVNHLP